MFNDDKLRKWMAPSALVLASALALAACNTAEGFGQDVENTGEAIEEEAK